MSLSILNSLVDELVDRYSGLVSEKYNIPKEDIIELLQADEEKTASKTSTKKVEQKSGPVQQTLDKIMKPKVKKTVAKSTSTTSNTSNTSTTSDVSEFSEEDLVRANKKELSAWCRMKGYKVSGTRAELMTRLLGKEPVKTTAPRKKATKKKGPTKEQAQNLVDRLVKKKKSPLPVRRNGFGNYEHSETGLVFDTNDHSVIGKQTEDEHGNGIITPLTPEDIDTCNRYNFSYRLPENLGHDRVTLDNVTVEGMDNEEEEELILDGEDGKDDEEEDEYEEVYEYVEE